MNAVRLAASVLALAYSSRTANAVVIPLPEMETVDQQGGCCYNYYNEHKCVCVTIASTRIGQLEVRTAFLHSGQGQDEGHFLELAE